MKSGKILVTPRSATSPLHSSLKLLTNAGFEIIVPSPGQVPSREQLSEYIKDVVGYLAGIESVDSELLGVANSLRVISRNGTGSDAIDLIAAKNLGIRVLTAPAANAQGVAELAISHMFLMIRGVLESVDGLRRGQWIRRPGIEVQGKTIGLIGCGQIGKRVASIAIALGMKVLAFDEYQDASFNPGAGFRYSDFEDVVSRAHVLSLHCPPSEKPLIDSSVLSKMVPNAFLINTARGSLVDLDAAHEALKSGKLAGFACDAFDPEPPGNIEIISHPNFYGTAHIGGYTQESIDRAMETSVKNLLEALEG